VSLAALICIKPGRRPRLIYRVHRGGRGGKDRRKGFTETDYTIVLDAAHQQLGGPLVVVRDNLNTHVSRAMAELIAAPGLAGHRPAAALCARAQPGRTGQVAPQEIPHRCGSRERS
jgi:hypothetical protein